MVVMPMVLCNVIKPLQHLVQKVKILKPQIRLWQKFPFNYLIGTKIMGWLLFTLKNAHVGEMCLSSFQARPYFFNSSKCISNIVHQRL